MLGVGRAQPGPAAIDVGRAAGAAAATDGGEQIRPLTGPPQSRGPAPDGELRRLSAASGGRTSSRPRNDTSSPGRAQGDGRRMGHQAPERVADQAVRAARAVPRAAAPSRRAATSSMLRCRPSASVSAHVQAEHGTVGRRVAPPGRRTGSADPRRPGRGTPAGPAPGAARTTAAATAEPRAAPTASASPRGVGPPGEVLHRHVDAQLQPDAPEQAERLAGACPRRRRSRRPGPASAHPEHLAPDPRGALVPAGSSCRPPVRRPRRRTPRTAPPRGSPPGTPGLRRRRRSPTGSPFTASRAARSERLPLCVTGSSATATHDRRHVRRRACSTQRPPDASPRRSPSSAAPGPQHQQQHHPGRARPGRVALLDGHRLGDLRHVRSDGVDLARPDAHAVDVEHAVRAAVQPRRPVGVELDQVAVRPHAGVVGEVGGVEPRAVRVADEADRPRRERVAADELADLADDLAAVLVTRRRPGPGCAPGSGPAHRQLGVAEHEAADDVRAAGDRLQRHRPTASATQSNCQSCSTAPVESIARSAAQVDARRAGDPRRPRSSCRYAGLVPNTVTPCSATSSQSVSGPGTGPS